MPESNPARVSGIVSRNPLEGPPDGAELTITCVPFLAPQDAKPLDWRHFGGALLQIGFKDATHVRVVGSAVMVAPCTALAASHVVTPELPGLLAGTVTSYLTAITRNGLDIWQIHQMIPLPESDLTLLTLHRVSELPPDRSLLQTAVASRMPDVGEKIMIAGFRSSNAEVPATGTRNEVTGEVRVSLGLVTDSYPEGRGQTYPWPVFAVGVNTLGGMSGGPAFDSTGRLIGILCSSMEMDDGNGPSFVSCIAPILDTEIENPLTKETASLRALGGRLCFLD